jgi:hypothetical protein
MMFYQKSHKHPLKEEDSKKIHFRTFLEEVVNLKIMIKSLVDFSTYLRLKKLRLKRLIWGLWLVILKEVLDLREKQ